jgi:hypothetical protein
VPGARGSDAGSSTLGAMPTSAADPKLWRLLSTVALVVAVVGLVLSASFGWIAFLLSGIFFAVELLLVRRERAGGPA